MDDCHQIFSEASLSLSDKKKFYTDPRITPYNSPQSISIGYSDPG